RQRPRFPCVARAREQHCAAAAMPSPAARGAPQTLALAPQAARSLQQVRPLATQPVARRSQQLAASDERLRPPLPPLVTRLQRVEAAAAAGRKRQAAAQRFQRPLRTLLPRLTS